MRPAGFRPYIGVGGVKKKGIAADAAAHASVGYNFHR